MVNAVVTALILVILTEGIGAATLAKLHIEDYGFAAPYGVAVLFAAMEIAYMPVMLGRLSFVVMTGVTMVVLVGAVVAWCFKAARLRFLIRGSFLIVLLAGALYTFLFYRYGTNIPLSSIDQLTIMVDNVGALSIDLGGFRLQGYLLFGSVLAWLFPGSLALPAYTLGLFAEMIAAMLTLNIVRSFRLKNPWLRFTFICFAVFYMNFYAWKITGSFQGGNWRVLFTAMLIYGAYRWLKTENEQEKYFLLFITGAGMFVSSGFLMVGIEVFYCLLVYLLRRRKIRTLFDFSTLMIPVVVYFCACLWPYTVTGAVVLFLALLLFCLMRYRKSVYHRIIWAENIMIEWATPVFYVIVPVCFLLGTFILRWFVPSLAVEYNYYIHYFQTIPMRIYMFLSRSMIDTIMCAVRWIGLIIFMIRAKTSEDRMFRTLFFGMLIFFINPLCMGMLGRITGLDMYADAFDILFNPFTDILLFVTIYRLFEWRVSGQWVLELSLVAAMLLGHLGSFCGWDIGLYTELLSPNSQQMEVVITE